MAKRKSPSRPSPKSKTTPKSTGAGDLGEGEEQPQSKIQLYTITTWSGLPHYHCALCDFDAMRLESMEAHIETHIPKVVLEEPANAPEVSAIYEIDLEELKEVLSAKNNLN